MKTIEIEQLKKMDLAGLNTELLSARKELFEIKFEVKNGQAKSSHLIPIGRKYVARIKTIMKEKETSAKAVFEAIFMLPLKWKKTATLSAMAMMSISKYLYFSPKQF